MNNVNFYNQFLENKLINIDDWQKLVNGIWSVAIKSNIYFDVNIKQIILDKADEIFWSKYKKLLDYAVKNQLSKDHFFNLIKHEYKNCIKSAFIFFNRDKRKVLFSTNVSLNTDYGSVNYFPLKEKIFNDALKKLIIDNTDNAIDENALLNYFGLNDENRPWKRKEIVDFYKKDFKWWKKLSSNFKIVINNSNLKMLL